MSNRFKIGHEKGFVTAEYNYDVHAWYVDENCPTRVYFFSDVCMEFYIPFDDLYDNAFYFTPFARTDDDYAVVDHRSEFSLVNDLYDKIDLLNKLLYAIEHDEEYGYLLPATGLTECENWGEWLESILQPGHCYKFSTDCNEFNVVVNWKCAVREDKLPDYKSLSKGELVFN